MTINEEINRFFLECEIRENILPNNTLPRYLQKLQYIVILTHREMDIEMLVRVLYQIRYEAGDELKNNTWNKVNILIQSSLDQIPYMSKLNLLEGYGDVPELLIKSLVKINTYRNQFAHPKINLLLNTYDIKNPIGKDNIQNLIRTLNRARDLFLKYVESSIVCNYCIVKQLNKTN